MSQSDFLIRRGSQDANNNGYFTGSAVLNSSLSNPLTSSIACRVFNEDNQNNWISGMYFVSSSVSGGMFVNIPQTKSVSIRGWGRMTNLGYGADTFSLLAKHNGWDVGAGTAPGAPSIARSGYEFGFDGGGNSGQGNRLFYRFGNYKVNDQDRNSISGYTGLSLANKWIGLRMDITPVRVNKIINGTPVSGTYKDIVRLYTASYDAPDNWTQIGNDYELLADGNQFVPWDSYTPIGSAQAAGTPILTASYGFFNLFYASTNERSYFDDFQIFVEDAF